MQIITTDKIAKSNGPYSQGYTHNGFFFTAGQIGVEPSDGELHVHTIEEQTDRACRNIGIMLEAAGTSFDKVIKANCFIADMDDFDAFNQVLYLQACSYLCGRKNTAQTCPLRNRSHRRTGRLDFQKS